MFAQIQCHPFLFMSSVSLFWSGLHKPWQLLQEDENCQISTTLTTPLSIYLNSAIYSNASEDLPADSHTQEKMYQKASTSLQICVTRTIECLWCCCGVQPLKGANGCASDLYA
jgi:hypothetical protein